MPTKSRIQEEADENRHDDERVERAEALTLRVEVFSEIVGSLSRVPPLTEMETVDDEMDPRERILRAVAALLGFDWPSREDFDRLASSRDLS
jgi:hypothetical protein